MTPARTAPELDALITYDDRLIRVATEVGLATLSPGIETV